MPQRDPVLDALTTFTRWPVQRTASGYRLRFDYSDYIESRINGVLFQPDRGPRLISKNYDRVPILFEMTQRASDVPELTTEVHYYTLNGFLHRPGKPAKYTIHPNGTVRMEYYLHGVPGRDDGPADLILHEVRTETILNRDGYELTGPLRMCASHAELNWIVDGRTNDWPGLYRANLTQLRICFDQAGVYADNPHSADQIEPALSVVSGCWWWAQSGAVDGELRPRWIEIADLNESYLNGVWQGRSGKFVASNWHRNEVVALDNFPPTYLIDQINLWFGPFTKDAAALVRLEHEFDERNDA